MNNRSAEYPVGEDVIEIRELPEAARAFLDPRAEVVAWTLLEVDSLRPGALSSPWALTAALRSTSDVLLRSYEPNRTCCFSRIESRHDAVGRTQLSLSLGLGVLGSPDEASEDVEHLARAALAALQRQPAPLNFKLANPAPLFDDPPRYGATIGQRQVSLTDEEDEVWVVSRWDHPEPQTWEELANLFMAHPAPLVLQASFVATELAPAEATELERRARLAEQIRLRAVESRNPVLAIHASRVVETLTDVALSFGGALWEGGIAVGSPEPLPRPLLRSIANAISSEFDVMNAGQAAPVVAARARLVGGYELGYSSKEAIETLKLGLPAAALRERDLHELFSATEAALAYRLVFGRVPTIPVEGTPGIRPPAGLPSDGVRLGDDAAGNSVHLGRVAGHWWLQGATGAGKSTALIAIAESCLKEDE